MNIYRNSLLRLSAPALLLLALTLFTTVAEAKGELSASVDRAQISMEDTLKLQVKYNEQVIFGEPDFSAVQQNFDVLGRTRSHQYHNINGKTESWTQWILTLAPTREGQLLIPSFEYKGSFSDAIEITVSEAPPATSSDQPVYLETELDRTSGYVQEQFLYTIRLYTSVDLSGLDRGELNIKNALMKTVAENQYQRIINGVPFGVVETTYAIFPQHSGTVEIPSTVWSVGIQSNRGYRHDPFLGQSGQQMRLRAPAKSIEVAAKPDSFTGEQWLPAHDVTLEQSWSRPPERFKLGEPITRTITIRAKGLMASQLPPLDVKETDGVKYYPDQPQTEESVSAEGVTAVKTESYAIVPARAGQITLPAITLRWWDTQAKRNREATLPAHTIVVSNVAEPADSAAASASDVTAPSQEADLSGPANDSLTNPVAESLASVNKLWFYAAIALALTNLLTLILWLNARRSPSQSGTGNPTAAPVKMSEKQAHRVLQQALKDGNAHTIRTALLAWGRIYEGNPNLSSLQQLAETLPPLAAPVRQIEAGLYGQHAGPIDTEALQQVLADLRRHGYQAATAMHDSSLPPLYGGNKKI